MKVYRIVVDEWPTPDGEPWARAYGSAAYFNDGEPLPAWLDSTIAKAGHGEGWRVSTRVQYDDADNVALVVMPKPKRVNYLSASGASELAANMRAFGAKVRVIASEPVMWREDS